MSTLSRMALEALNSMSEDEKYKLLIRAEIVDLNNEISKILARACKKDQTQIRELKREIRNKLYGEEKFDPKENFYACLNDYALQLFHEYYTSFIAHHKKGNNVEKSMQLAYEQVKKRIGSTSGFIYPDEDFEKKANTLLNSDHRSFVVGWLWENLQEKEKTSEKQSFEKYVGPDGKKWLLGPDGECELLEMQ